MTQRSGQVEPPFARREIQLTVALIVAVAFAWLGVVSARDALLPDPTAIANARLEGGHRLDRDAKSHSIQIDLNSAASRELALLPGVGPVLAKRIIENRERLGPFSSVNDLSRVYGVGPKTLAHIRPLCVADPVVMTSESGVTRIAATEPANQ